MGLRAAAVAAAVAITTTGTLARVSRNLVRDYFPLADEWPILAHSHPRTADPRSWFAEGFKHYFTPAQGLPDGGGYNFARPLFNATYWAVGKWVAPESGRYLHIAHVGIGACAGLASLAVSRSGGSLRAAAITGSVVPFMPAFVPSGPLLVYPCMAFDPAAAGLSQSAVMAYDGGRFRTAAGFLIAGVLTKETALPTAGALPALYALERRGDLLRSRRSQLGLATLAAPAGIWYAIHRAAYGRSSRDETAYPLRNDPRGWLVRQARIASKFPFWTNFSAVRAPGWSLDKAAAGSQLLSNALVMGGMAVELGARVRADRRFTANEASFLASYAFLSAVGTSPRYGSTFDMSLLTNLARWRAEGPRVESATRAATAGLALGVVAGSLPLARDFRRLERNFLAYAEVGRKYVTALRLFDAGSRVLVLNDPATFWAPVKWLTTTMGIKAEVIKLADYPFNTENLEGMQTPSTVELQPPSGPGEPWRFAQSEGLDILSSHPNLPTEQHVHVDYGDGITIDLEPRDEDAPPTRGHRRWAAMRIVPGDRPAHLLYYDPAIGEFQVVATH